MAFTQKELEIIKYGLDNGKSREEVATALGKLRAGVTSTQTTEATKPDSFIDRTGSVIQGAGQRVNEAITGEGSYAGRSLAGRSIGAVGEAFGAVPAVVAEALPEPAREATSKVGEFLGGIVNKLGEAIGSIPAVQKWVTEHPEAASALEETAKTASSAGQIAGTILAAKGTAAGAQKVADTATIGAQKTGQAVSAAVERARPATQALYERSSELIKPKPTPVKAIGEVLQGKKPVTARDIEAFRNIDTTKVKTYADLQKEINRSIGDLSQKVDDVLDQDPTPIPLAQLVTKTTSGSGRVVERNFVETAMRHLKELYEQSADDVARADIDDLITKAKETGLSRREVNDISRIYNSEFGTKAFSKVTGEPLTSVNAQAYENIRKGLKDVARQGIGGAEAQAADRVVSSLYNTRDLVTKNVQAVQKLQQRIAERGLLEKVGSTVAKYGDILTGGSLRGLVGGLLPRGAGYKILNALDLEERLSKNLEIIRKAIESGSDEAILKATRQLQSSVGPALTE